MLKSAFFAIAATIVLAAPAHAAPPADLDACLTLATQTATATQIATEAQYVKFHSKMLDLNSACGLQDFEKAEKVSQEIKAEFPQKK